MTKEKESPKKKKKNALFFLSSIFSLILTFVLITLLIQNVEAFSHGESSGSLIIYTLLEAIGLFFIPIIFNPRAVKKRLNRNSKSPKSKAKSDLDLRIARMVRLNPKYSPNLIVKCPKCGFDNPSKTKICFNCAFNLNF
ncbi:hypothetical protein NEF87_004144 [Candidatus Lokiarchaeum ossiferum]|uniref:Zinc ribbon domain-containing protein n=1 Tax=Candidatus Lokiarchaeum ossiferum TaxID=2951803 RepID=A0ABY6HWF5_9ARCH|nr:hypothetical protein NEF87_004144 [Candidatus Lokiarchaeum sp. B-35]